MDLSREQTKVLIENAKARGIPKASFMDSLIKNGNNIEGIDSQSVLTRLNEEETTQTQGRVEQNPILKQVIDVTNRFSPIGMARNAIERAPETFEDIKQTVTGVMNQANEGQANQIEIGERTIGGEQSAASGGLQIAGQGVRTSGDIVGELFKGIVKVVLPAEQEQQVKQFLVNAVEGYTNLGDGNVGEGLKFLEEEFNLFAEENPELAKNLVAGGQIVEGVAEFATGGQAGNAKRVVSEVVDQAGNQVDNVVGSVTRNVDELRSQFNQVRQVADDVPVVKKPQTIEEALKDTATGITEENANLGQKAVAGDLLSARDKKRLLPIEPETGNKYLDRLEASELDDEVPPIFELATEDTQKVFDEFETINRQTGSDIGKIKEKINRLPVDKPKIQTVIDDIDFTLSKAGLRKNDIGEYEKIKGSNTPFTPTDINNINIEIVEVLENIKNATTNEQLILGMESLGNKIDFNLSTDISRSLQGLSKTTNRQLKEIRDSLLTTEEASRFTSYSKAKTVIDEFNKSDNKIKTLINREDSMRAGDLQKVARTLKEATGKDIRDYTRLMKILIEASPSNGVNRSLLAKQIGEGAELGAELVSGRPLGILSGILKSAGKQFLDVDKLQQVKKAIDFVPTNNTK